jgi:hypothetical protein
MFAPLNSNARPDRLDDFRNALYRSRLRPSRTSTKATDTERLFLALASKRAT